ncbi:MAG: type III pantothenate kinase [Candidatus Omnitrophica bacterium]|nr:type III pantothenate kinase [Candidatus Omnitrophota bacterium]
MTENLLAIDIGNTNITAGLFAGGRLVKKSKTPTGSYFLYGRHLRKMVRASSRESGESMRVIISSVVPLALARLIVEINRTMKCDIKIVGRDKAVPIKNLYKNKSEVGQDRLVNAFAAGRLYGSPCVVVDFGTAVTFDVVSGRGEYLGGLILPGIEMSLSGLHRMTAMLPRVELKHTSSVIGRDTVNSIRGGILFGLGAVCDGLAARYRKLLGRKTRIIATGGNAGLISRYAKSIRIVDEDLTLKGLRMLMHHKQ